MCRRDCKRSGLEIRSSVFWSNRSSFVIERSIDRFNLEKDWQERIDHVNLLKRSKIEGSDSIFWHKKGGKLSKTYESIVFCDRPIDSILKMIESIFRKRSTRSIQSRSIFFKDWKDRKIEDRRIERSNSQPCKRCIRNSCARELPSMCNY